MKKTLKRALSSVTVLTICAAAAFPVLAGTGPTAGSNDSVIGRGYIDFEQYAAGTVVTTNLQDFSAEHIFGAYQGLGITNSIVDDNGNKVLKIVKGANIGGDSGFKLCANNWAEFDDAAVDYWVIKYDLKNGDSASNYIPYINHHHEFRDDGEAITFNGRQTINAYDWNEYMFIGDRNTGKIRLVLNGTDCGEVQSNRIANADNFYGVQVIDTESKNYERVMYADDVEIYAVKQSTHTASPARLSMDAESGRVYVEFDCPAQSFTESNITTTAGTVSAVTYVNGKYEIQFTGIAYGTTATVTIVGVKDIFGSDIPPASIDIEGPKVTTVKVGYQSTDYENLAVTTGGGYFTNGSASIDGYFENAYPTAGRDFDIVEKDGSKVMKITEDSPGQNYCIWLNYRNKTGLTASDPDWYVLSYDMQNGDDSSNCVALVQQKREYLRNDGTTLQNYAGAGCMATLIDGVSQPIKQYAMNHYTMVGDSRNGKVYLALGSKLVAVQNEAAEGAITTPITTFYNSQKGVLYFDNWEEYGLNNGDIVNEATLTQGGDNVIYADFDLPLSAAGLTADKITINNGGTVSEVDFDVNAGKWKLTLGELVPGNTYTVTVAGVIDVFGTMAAPASTTITTPREEMPKSYLTTSTYKGHEDFESYNTTGIFESKVNPTVAVTRNDSVNIRDIWSHSTGSSDTVECALADDGTGNHAYKIASTAGAAQNHTTGIFQPVPDVDWTEQCVGKYFVYEIRFRGGSDTEEPLGTVFFETKTGAASLDLLSGLASFNDGSCTLNVKDWNRLQYIVNYTLDTPTAYLYINGELLGTEALTANRNIKNGQPRMGSCYLSGEAGASLYYDDVKHYTVSPVTINSVDTTSGITAEISSAFDINGSGYYPADIWVGVFDSNERLVNAAKLADKIAYGVNDYTADNISVADGQKVKVFVWAYDMFPMCDVFSK